MDDPVRFADILSTASAVANYLGAEEVTPGHMLDAIDVLLERKTMDELAPPTSPFVASRQPQATVATPVQDVVRRWFEEIGRDINATLAGPELDRFAADLRAAEGGMSESWGR